MVAPRSPDRRRRQTHRKRLIREALESTYRGRAVILDELRWTVMEPQLLECSEEKARHSLLNSFARTVRDHLTDHVIEKIPLSPRTPVGLVARAAVYRMKDANALRGFLNAEDPCIFCGYKTNIDVDEPRYEPRSRFVRPQYHAATFRFFERRPSKIAYHQLETAPGTFVPATQNLTLIVPRGATVDSALIAAKVPWKLFAYENLSQLREVKGTDALELVQRNRYH